jgi:hypothetical protein
MLIKQAVVTTGSTHYIADLKMMAEAISHPEAPIFQPVDVLEVSSENYPVMP